MSCGQRGAWPTSGAPCRSGRLGLPLEKVLSGTRPRSSPKGLPPTPDRSRAWPNRGLREVFAKTSLTPNPKRRKQQRDSPLVLRDAPRCRYRRFGLKPGRELILRAWRIPKAGGASPLPRVKYPGAYDWRVHLAHLGNDIEGEYDTQAGGAQNGGAQGAGRSARVTNFVVPETVTKYDPPFFGGGWPC